MNIKLLFLIIFLNTITFCKEKDQRQKTSSKYNKLSGAPTTPSTTSASKSTKRATPKTSTLEIVQKVTPTEKTTTIIQVDTKELVFKKESFEFIASPKTDLIILYNDDGKIGVPKQHLEKNLNDFLANIFSKKLDINAVIIANYLNNIKKYDKLKLIKNSITSKGIITTLNDFFKTDPVFRKNASIEVVIITDDNAAKDSYKNFNSTYTNKPVTVHGIIGLTGENGANNGCRIRKVGTEYRKLSESTNGLVIDICGKNWHQLSDRLAKVDDKLVAASAFILADRPQIDLEIIVKVDGVKLDKKDYSLNPETRELRIAPTKLVQPRATIQIEYYSLPD